MSNLVQIFFDTASRYPDHNAILFQNQSINYQGLAKRTSATATYLKNKGVKKGTKVLVFIPMSIKLYQTVLALFSLGAVVVFVDEWADRKRLQKALKVVPVDVIIAPRKYLWLAYFLSPFKKISSKIAIPNRLTAASLEPTKVKGRDTALITFTTGSTGLPKAANRTHKFLQEQFRILKKEIGAKPGERCLVTLPIVLLSILGTGASGIIADFNQKKPEKLDPVKQLDMMQKESVSLLISSPYYVDKLASNVEDVSLPLRKILTGGAPVFPDMAERIVHSFPKSECLVAYGSTEAEPISVSPMTSVVIDENGLFVGQVHKEVDLKIIRITEGEILLGEDGWQAWEVDFGEIVVTGPHVLDAYYNSDEAFKLNKISEQGKIWHRTGDSGRIVEGNLYLSGRTSQLVKSKAGYQSLFLMEYELSQVPGIALGTILEQEVILELEEGANESQVRSGVTALNLNEERIRIIETMPRDPRHFSKIDYKALRNV